MSTRNVECSNAEECQMLECWNAGMSRWRVVRSQWDSSRGSILGHQTLVFLIPAFQRSSIPAFGIGGQWC